MEKNRWTKLAEASLDALGAFLAAISIVAGAAYGLISVFPSFFPQRLVIESGGVPVWISIILTAAGSVYLIRYAVNGSKMPILHPSFSPKRTGIGRGPAPTEPAAVINSVSSSSVKRVMIVGAGDAAKMLIEDMRRPANTTMLPVALLDDDPAKLGTVIMGVPVAGKISSAMKVAAEFRADEALIAIPSADGDQVRRIISMCGTVKCRVVPGTMPIIRGRAGIADIRRLKPEDLIGREVFEADFNSLKSYIAGKTILVTGAAGSIGSELCRVLAVCGTKEIVMLDSSELGLDSLMRDPEMVSAARDVSRGLVLRPVLGDIRDKVKLNAVFDRYRPEVVFHAAAYKHLPMMEQNPAESVRTNIFGTINVAESAERYGVEKFVFISTDKAVNPTSVMGATKFAAERALLARNADCAASGKPTRYMMVRFGNVFASRGSVVPVFLEQIGRGGPVTVTHPEVIRYFMTVREAASLVLEAATIGVGGEIFVLDMGRPIKILDLAKSVISMCGFEPGKDIAIEFTGLRPGEKMGEELTMKIEELRETSCKKIFMVDPAEEQLPVPREIAWQLFDLHDLAERHQPAVSIKRSLMRIAPAYRPSDFEPGNDYYGAVEQIKPARLARRASNSDLPGRPNKG